MRLIAEPTLRSEQAGADGRETSLGRVGDAPGEFPNPSSDLVMHVGLVALVNGFETLRSAAALLTLTLPLETGSDPVVWVVILTKLGIAGILGCSAYISPDAVGGSHRFIRNMCLFGLLLHCLFPPIGISPLLPNFGWYWCALLNEFLFSYAIPAVNADTARREWVRHQMRSASATMATA
mgnify:CR=1 FL=1